MKTSKSLTAIPRRVGSILINRPRPPQKTVFFHPPKCGGTSVGTALKQAHERKYGRRQAIFELNAAASKRAGKAIGVSMPRMRESILSYAAALPNVELILGHFPYSNNVFSSNQIAANCTTILRNPVDRILSHYYFNRYKKDDGHFTIHVDLEEWLLSDRSLGAATIFTQMFVGDQDIVTSLSDHTINNARLDQAVKLATANLETFCVVGILEKKEVFFEDIKKYLGLELRVPHKRKSPRQDYPKFYEQPKKIQDRIMKICDADIKIYNELAGKSR